MLAASVLTAVVGKEELADFRSPIVAGRPDSNIAKAFKGIKSNTQPASVFSGSAEKLSLGAESSRAEQAVIAPFQADKSPASSLPDLGVPGTGSVLGAPDFCAKTRRPSESCISDAVRDAAVSQARLPDPETIDAISASRAGNTD
eukprot:scaffold220972_cov40-Prasinocladus_malaysianus.AAC.1